MPALDTTILNDPRYPISVDNVLRAHGLVMQDV